MDGRTTPFAGKEKGQGETEHRFSDGDRLPETAGIEGNPLAEMGGLGPAAGGQGGPMGGE